MASNIREAIRNRNFLLDWNHGLQLLKHFSNFHASVVWPRKKARAEPGLAWLGLKLFEKAWICFTWDFCSFAHHYCLSFLSNLCVMVRHIYILIVIILSISWRYCHWYYTFWCSSLIQEGTYSGLSPIGYLGLSILLQIFTKQYSDVWTMLEPRKLNSANIIWTFFDQEGETGSWGSIFSVLPDRDYPKNWCKPFLKS